MTTKDGGTACKGLPALPLRVPCVEFGRARHSVRAADGFVICRHVPARDESRHSHMQRMVATISAIQLRPIGIVSVLTVTWA